MQETTNINFFDEKNKHVPDFERAALLYIQPKGMIIRHPPKPHELDTEITPDTQLFQTIHMGVAIVNPITYRLIIDGLVAKPFSLTLEQLKALPPTTITTFHECYGSPLKPPTTPLWRIGNVRWTGVSLRTLLATAQPHDTATHVWSEGLEHGKFAHITADRYQKDLPLSKATQPEVLLAYELNGASLTKERGFPVRLIVPGWFGTNSTKWVCRLSLRDCRAPGPFTTTLYNEIDPLDPEGRRMRPVWTAEVNSMICRPKPEEVLSERTVRVWGRAWGAEEVVTVEVSIDGGAAWIEADVEPRREFAWQRWEAYVVVPDSCGESRSADGTGKCTIVARATDRSGIQQPLKGRRNHVHSVEVLITQYTYRDSYLSCYLTEPSPSPC